MAANSIAAPSTPTGNGRVEHSVRVETGLDTPTGTAASSASTNSAPRTPQDLDAAQVTELPSSHASSDAANSDPATKGENSNGRDMSSPIIKIEKSSDDANDPFVSGNTKSANDTPYRPRPDRLHLRSEITPEIAQAMFPAGACVFVANLVASKSDEQLRDAVHGAFSSFGICYVKVKRDSSNMPYAFCQFEDVGESNEAIKHGRGALIFGRPCRTERAKVNRALFLTRTTGGPITEQEARKLLAGMGDIETVWFTDPTDAEMFKLPEGIWIQFAYFQDSRDAANSFKDNLEFRLEQPQLPDEVKAKLVNARAHVSLSKSHTPVRSAPTNTPASRHGNALDATSIFVGNLNTSVALDSLRMVFGKFGPVRNIEIVCRPGMTGSTVHAYVDFESPRAADRALNAEHVLGNVHLRVERRQSAPYAMMRPNGSRFSSSNGSPRHRSFIRNGNSTPSTPISGGLFAPVTPGDGSLAGGPYFPMFHNVSPFLQAPYSPANHGGAPPMHAPAGPMVYGSPAHGNFHGDHGFGPLGFNAGPPPAFALPPAPMMLGQPRDIKNNNLPPVPEHQGH